MAAAPPHKHTPATRLSERKGEVALLAVITVISILFASGFVGGLFYLAAILDR